MVQISVKVKPDQLEFIERTAKHEGRTMAGWIRQLIAEAERQALEQERDGRRRSMRQK
jgi:uncharacterized protein (DUF1778 family)